METCKTSLVNVRGIGYVVRWVDPLSGRVRQQSCHTDDRGMAERVQRDVSDRIAAGQVVNPDRVTWEAFRDVWDEQKVPELAVATCAAYDAAFELVERFLTVPRVCDLTGPRIEYLKSRARKAGLLDTTIAKHLRHLKAALRWGHVRGYVRQVPHIEMPKRARGAKSHGRPLTDEELERFFAKVPDVVGTVAGPGYVRLCKGAYYSGLRRNELLSLSWDADGDPRVERLGNELVIRFSRESQKSNEDEVWAVPPRFGALLEETSPAARHGRVFSVLGKRGAEVRCAEEVSKAVTAIGKAAGIVVATHPIKKTKKYASLHDLRRTFATWWAHRVPASILRELMRHQSVQTTEDYYVGINAVAMAKVLRAIDGEKPAEVRLTNQVSSGMLPA